MNWQTAHSSWWRRGHGPWLVTLAVLLGLTGCGKDPVEVTVPGHERVVHGSYAGHISSWPNEEGLLEFTAQLEAQWVSEGIYAVTGDLITNDGTAHPVIAKVFAYNSWVFVPAPDTTLTPAASAPIFYHLTGRVPALSLSFCAQESFKDYSWSGRAWVSWIDEIRPLSCGEQFGFRLDRGEQDPVTTRH